MGLARQAQVGAFEHRQDGDWMLLFGALFSCAGGRRLAGRPWTQGELALADRIFRPRRSWRALRLADRVVAGVASRAQARGLADDGAVVCHGVYRKCDRRLARRVLEQYG